MLPLSLAAIVWTAAPPIGDISAQIQAKLQQIALNKSVTYNCSVSIGFKNADYAISAAAGTIDFGSGREASI